MSPLELRVPPPVMAVVTALLMYVGSCLSPGDWHLEAADWVTGLVLVVALGMGAAAVMHFFRVGTTAHPHCPEKSSCLVAHGIYRYSRNPMYLALLLLLVAWSLYLGWILSPLGWGLFVLWITRFQIRPEERALERVFGEDYRAYCRRVRRWL